MPFLAEGTAAPPFSLHAVPTKRKVNMPPGNGAPAMMLFVGAQTATSMESVVRDVRRRYPDPSQLLIINVVDLRGVPRLLRSTAETIMRAAYDKAAEQIPNGHDPAEHLILLPDWKGLLFKAYGIPDVNKYLALVMVDEDGAIRGHYHGPDIGEAAVKLAGAYVAADEET